MTIQLLLNDNILSYVKQRGITEVFAKIALGLSSVYGDKLVICTKDPNRYPFARCIKLPRYYRGSYYLSLNDRIVSLICLKERPQIVINACAGSVITFAKQVQMAYDMIPELFPQYFPSNNIGGKLMLFERKRAYQTANCIIADSHNTAQDLLRIYPSIPPQKIRVAHLGVDFPDNVDDCFNKFSRNSSKPFFVFIGHRNKYKNFIRALEAFALSGLANEYDFKVVSPIPNDMFSYQEQLLINQYQLNSSIYLFTDITQSSKNELIHQSTALIYPSEYEGFGLPILEAMGCGTLVATSNVSSMPEVGGDVAFYFDPYNISSIANCLLQIATLTKDVRQIKINQGVERAKNFTWQSFQQQVNAVVNSLLET